jgi:hypothetical protein
MTQRTALDTDGLPPLPHWDSVPDDLPSAIRAVKAALRARIAASGRSVEEVFAVIERRVRDQVEEIVAAKRRGEPVWPEIDYADIAAGTVSPAALSQLRRRGCLVVRGNFPREQALAWDQGIVDYIEGNQFFENYRGLADDFFDSVTVSAGSTRAATRCTRTASAAARRVPTRRAWGPTSTPARSTCG